MLIGSHSFLKRKYDFIDELDRKVKSTEVMVTNQERMLLKEKKDNVESAYLKGFGGGCLVSAIALSNFSFLFSKSKPFVAFMLVLGPATFPVFWRVREEYELQNMQLTLARRYLVRDDEDF